MSLTWDPKWRLGVDSGTQFHDRINLTALQLRALQPSLKLEVASCLPSTNEELMIRLRSLSSLAALLSNAKEPISARVHRSVEGRAFSQASSRGVDPTLLVAIEQTQGRGRQGRQWIAEPGASLTFSLAWPWHGKDLSGLSLAVAVNLAEALDPFTTSVAPLVCIKWPNDLWLCDPVLQNPCHGKKLAGILIESLMVSEQRWLVIGIGLNVLPLSAHDHELITNSASVQSIWPAQKSNWLSAFEVVAPALIQTVMTFESLGWAHFATSYAHRDVLAGQHIEWQTPTGERLQGQAQGVDDDGALRVLTSVGLQRLISGEVAMALRPAIRSG
jgi:BirA family transcriptional regulator, biotin operon repressor / biotin---[acetyl-CoA-carboxylase] ligase